MARKLDTANFLSSSTMTAELEQELKATQQQYAESQQELLNLQQVVQELNTRLATLGSEAISSESATEVDLPIKQIQIDPEQARRWFNPERQAALTESIRLMGIQSRLWVQPLPNGKYRLIAGERRLRSAKTLNLQSVPVIILDVDDKTALKLSLLENSQREDVSPIEETWGTLRLLGLELNVSQEEVCRLLYRMKHKAEGRAGENVSPQDEQVVETVFNASSRIGWASFIKTRLPLLKLPEEVLEALWKGQLDYTKALAIGRIKDEEGRRILLDTAIAADLSLTEIRQKIQEVLPSPTPRSLKGEFQEVLQLKSEAWKDPNKAKQIRACLNKLKTLLESSSD